MGLVHAELARNPLTEQKYRYLLERVQDENAFVTAVSDLLVQTIKQDPRFSICLPHRLIQELAAILWAQVADWLIHTSSCSYSNFGSFDVVRRGGVLRVEFTPSTIILKNAGPEAMHSQYGGETVADKYCRSVLDPIREQVLDWPSLGTTQESHAPLIATALLTIGLNEVWRVFVLEGISPERVEGDEDWLTLLSMAASFATYYAWTSAFGIEIHSKSTLFIDDIGRFTKEESAMRFEPTSQFVDLIYYNTPEAKAA